MTIKEILQVFQVTMEKSTALQIKEAGLTLPTYIPDKSSNDCKTMDFRTATRFQNT